MQRNKPVEKVREFKRGEKLMGNQFELTVVSDDAWYAEEQIQKAILEIKRIEQLLTTFSDNSMTNQVNSMAGIAPVKVNSEFFALVKRSIKISSITDGAFDISYGSLDKRFWNFDKTMTQLPDAQSAKSMVRLINFRNILLDEREGSIMLKEKGMRIGFGGIGKGYAAEMAKNLLQKDGVQNGVVNASGDLTTWGTQANGEPWTIGIADPDRAFLPYGYLKISDMAVATSGNYEKYVMINGKKYSHTINPKTGFPVTGIKSTTIFSSNAEVADALATPVTVMGVKAGLNLVNQLDQVECIIIDDHNQLYASKNIHIQ